MTEYDTLMGDYGDKTYSGNPTLINPKELDKLSQVTLDMLGLNIDLVKQELIGMGSDLIDPTTGKPFPDGVYQAALDRNVSNAEQKFDIVIRPRVKVEQQDYVKQEFNNFISFEVTQKPAIQVLSMRLQLGNQQIMDIDPSWIKLTQRFGQVQVVPNSAMNAGFLGLANNSIPMLANPGLAVGGPAMYLGSANPNTVPQMIGVKYIAGMLPRMKKDKNIQKDWYLPDNLSGWIAKQASIDILEKYGRIGIGVGIAGYDINFDGMHTAAQTTGSAENSITSADIRMLQEDCKTFEDSLKAYYGLNSIWLA